MAQVDNYQVPAHPSGLEMRTQLNAIILALIGDNAGPMPPTQTFPGMMWGDTSANRLRRRNNDNSAWLDIGPLDDFLGDMKTSVNNVTNGLAGKVSKTGDTMTGQLTMDRTPSDFGYSVSQLFQSGGSWERSSLIRYSYHAADGGALEWVNSPRNAVNMHISDYGTLRVRTSVVAGYRLSLGGSDLGFAGTGYGEIELRSQDGTWCRMRGRGGGGGMEWVNHGYNAVIMTMDDGGTLHWPGGGGTLGTNGNVWMSFRGQWLSTALDDIWNHAQHGINVANGRAPWGAECQHNSGLAEFGRIVQGSSGHGEVTCPGPWVMVGLRGAYWETWARGIVLRNV